MGILEDQLIGFIQKCSFEELPSNVIASAKKGILDWLGVTVAGSQHKSVETLLAKLADDQGAAGWVEVIGHARRLHPFWAALVNGVSTHVLDFDDVYVGGILHPGGPVLNALFIACSNRQVSGRDFLTAYVTGVEILTRLGKAVSPNHYLAGWHATATLGTIGAAAALGKLGKLSREELHASIGFAATQAAGLRESFGTMAKSFHVGKAAMNGLLSVQLAQVGMRAGEKMLSGENGWLRATAGRIPEAAEVVGDYRDYQMVSIIFKKYASCFETHPSIEAAVSMHKKIKDGRMEEMSEVVLRVPAIAKEIARIDRPQTALEAKFCLAYCAAVGLVKGRAGLTEFTDEAIVERKVREVFNLTRLEVDDSMKGAEAVITLNSPRGVFREHVQAAPSLGSFQEVKEKHKECCSGLVPESQIQHVSISIEQIEQISDMRTIFSNLLH